MPEIKIEKESPCKLNKEDEVESFNIYIDFTNSTEDYYIDVNTLSFDLDRNHLAYLYQQIGKVLKG